MQERLDEELDEARARELVQHLESDAEAAEENQKLEQVHQLLDKAPPMRAPQRLAATIMARLTQTLKAQAMKKDLAPDVRLALMLSVSTVTVTMMPVMLAASYLVMNAWRNPKLLTQVIYRIIAMQAMMIDALVILMEEAEDLLQDDPELAPVAVSLIPVTLIGMLEAMEGDIIDNLEIAQAGSPDDA
jgi:anti-sigma factor RsiW